MNSDTSLLVTRRMAAISWSRRLCPRAVDGAKAAIIVGAVVGPVAAVICGNNLNQHGECFNP